MLLAFTAKTEAMRVVCRRGRTTVRVRGGGSERTLGRSEGNTGEHEMRRTPVACFATEEFAQPGEEKDKGELLELLDALLPLLLGESVLVVVAAGVVGCCVDGGV